MDSKKVGQGTPSALTNNSPVQKSKRIQKDIEALAPKAKEEKGDFSVELSDKAKEIAESRMKAMEIARKTPDIREDRVADLKARIESGQYKPDAGQIADGMMREAIRDELAKGSGEV